MTEPVFSFDNISHSRNSDALSCSCVVAADMPFFNGHFPDLPIMPAVAQIEMIQALLQRQPGWNAIISGGTRLKFSDRIRPGDILTIRLHRTSVGEINFTVENGAGIASKGILQLGDSALD
ncbi:MAG: hypothetical protein GY807_17340 [Gammaproteobacteria bacterium]|nr:hypothetical protein [Gammaproteobacteria bacterium]